jgi:hypothetical protein
MSTDENRLSQKRGSTPEWVASVRTIIIILIALALVVAIGWRVSVLFTPNPPVLAEHLVNARELILLIDITKSLNDGGQADTFQDMKRYAVNKVLPNVGPGDRVSCYTIATTFVEAKNRVFEKELPPVPEWLLSDASPHRETRPVIDFAGLWAPVERALSPTGDGWALKISTLNQEQRGHTDYLGAFRYLSDRLNSPEHRKTVSHTFVLVLGDLLQDPTPDPFEPPLANETERLAFSGVHIALVVPFRSKEAPGVKNREEVQAYWNNWFTNRGATTLQFATLDTTPLPFPESFVPRTLQSQGSLRGR